MVDGPFLGPTFLILSSLQTVAQEWKVEAMPTFLFIKEGNEVEKIVGAQKEELPKKVELLAAI